MKRQAEETGVAALREALGKAGFELRVRPSPRKLDLRPASEGGRWWFELDYSPGSEVKVLDRDAAERLVLVGLIEPPARDSLALLGQDESMLFAQAVFPRFAVPPGVDPEVRTVRDALDALTPDAVHEARRKGLVVVRQGDIWFVPVVFGAERVLLGTRHEAQGLVDQAGAPMASGWVTHPQHAPVQLDGLHWVYRNRVGD